MTLNLSNKELFKALIIGYEYACKGFTITSLQFVETMPTISVLIIEDYGIDSGELLKLSLPIHFESCRANYKHRETLSEDIGFLMSLDN